MFLVSFSECFCWKITNGQFQLPNLITGGQLYTSKGKIGKKEK